MPQVDVLSDAQLLAIIIRNGRGGRSAVDLGIELLEKFGSLDGIARAGINEIRGKNGVKGIGPAKIAEIKAAIELGRRHQKPSLSGASFCSSGNVVSYYQPRMKDLKKESFGAPCSIQKIRSSGMRSCRSGVSLLPLSTRVRPPRPPSESPPRRLFLSTIIRAETSSRARAHPAHPAAGPCRRGARHPGARPHHHRRREPLQFQG